MKFLSEKFSNAPFFIMDGWKKVLESFGHEWRWLESSPISEFDAFKPDIFIGTTYGLDRAKLKALKSHPKTICLLKSSNFGPCQKDINTEIYPISMVEETEKFAVESIKNKKFVFNFYHLNQYDYTMSGWKEVGCEFVEGLPAADIFDYTSISIDPTLECDIAFVGGYWPYKAENLNKYILPLCHPVGKYNIKIFGNQPWPVPQYMGPANNNVVNRLFSSAKICPNISEPHANIFGFEVNERVFKLAASKCFIINDKIQSLEDDIFTKHELIIADEENHFADLIDMFLTNPDLRKNSIESCYNTVIKSHTYHHRVSNALNKMGFAEEARKIIDEYSLNYPL